MLSKIEQYADVVERCTLSTPLEIIALMHEIRDRGVTVTLRPAQGKHSLVSVLVDVDPQNGEILFDASAAAAREAQLAGAPSMRAHTVIDNIRIRFETGPARLVIHGGRAALASPLPATALRVQRREAFRIEAPIDEPLYCRVRDGGGERLYKVRDISTTGLAWIHPADEEKPETGTRIAQCRLDLPGTGVVNAGLEVMTIRVLKTRPDSGSLVACRFVGLPGAEATVLQRYINNLQRDRRART